MQCKFTIGNKIVNLGLIRDADFATVTGKLADFATAKQLEGFTLAQTTAMITAFNASPLCYGGVTGSSEMQLNTGPVKGHPVYPDVPNTQSIYGGSNGGGSTYNYYYVNTNFGDNRWTDVYRGINEWIRYNNNIVQPMATGNPPSLMECVSKNAPGMVSTTFRPGALPVTLDNATSAFFINFNCVDGYLATAGSMWAIAPIGMALGDGRLSVGALAYAATTPFTALQTDVATNSQAILGHMARFAGNDGTITDANAPALVQMTAASMDDTYLSMTHSFGPMRIVFGPPGLKEIHVAFPIDSLDVADLSTLTYQITASVPKILAGVSKDVVAAIVTSFNTSGAYDTLVSKISAATDMIRGVLYATPIQLGSTFVTSSEFGSAYNTMQVALASGKTIRSQIAYDNVTYGQLEDFMAARESTDCFVYWDMAAAAANRVLTADQLAQSSKNYCTYTISITLDDMTKPGSLADLSTRTLTASSITSTAVESDGSNGSATATLTANDLITALRIGDPMIIVSSTWADSSQVTVDEAVYVLTGLSLTDLRSPEAVAGLNGSPEDASFWVYDLSTLTIDGYPDVEVLPANRRDQAISVFTGIDCQGLEVAFQAGLLLSPDESDLPTT
jgi:hypothetical protein